jgi:hypothetical protein
MASAALSDASTRIDAALEAKRSVVLIRDVVLADRLGYGPWPIPGHAALVEGRVGLPVTDERDRRWAELYQP